MTEFRQLMDKYLTNTILVEERQRLLRLIASQQYRNELESVVDEAFAGAVDGEEDTELRELIFQAIRQRRSAPVVKMPYRRIAAACVILALSIGSYLWISHRTTSPTQQMAVQTPDLAPGKQGAILTLANGSKIVLDSLKNGHVTTQGNALVSLDNGALVYAGSEGEMLYNTMSTPKGRQFQLRLSDGTQVWLNAASSISYPTVFKGQVRQVDVKGEAYFEVAQNTNMPFRVNVNNKEVVEVLGTHFNVNAYDNEKSINTTLLEGAVRVVSGGMNGDAVLKPGQQARVSTGMVDGTGIKVISNADIDRVMAWKNGMFSFEDARLDEVMRQLERWYDIEVTYEKGVPDIELMGKMTRDVSLKGLMLFLERLGVHCRLEGRKLIVISG
ncbi:MAG: FecR domain-containing protein [Chitinophagaceae bacterium]|nr:FecR domain-containing protein [Chitinophagaceae bacterium]